LKRLPEVYLLDNQQIRAWQCIEDIGFQRWSWQKDYPTSTSVHRFIE
jgi:hypothetical protein